MVEANPDAAIIAGVPQTGFDSDEEKNTTSRGSKSKPIAPIREYDESKLARKEHWDNTFQMELENFENNGDDGEVWFGADVQKKTVAYILD